MATMKGVEFFVERLMKAPRRQTLNYRVPMLADKLFTQSDKSVLWGSWVKQGGLLT